MVNYDYLTSYFPEDYFFEEYFSDSPNLIIVAIPVMVYKNFSSKVYLNRSISKETEINTELNIKSSVYK